MDSTPGCERQRSRISRGDPAPLAGDNGINEHLVSMMGSLVNRRGPKRALVGLRERQGMQFRPKDELQPVRERTHRKVRGKVIMNTKSIPERRSKRGAQNRRAYTNSFSWARHLCMLRNALLGVAHREKMIHRDCIQCTTSFPENFHYESKRSIAYKG